MMKTSYSKEDLIKAVDEYKNGFSSSEVATRYQIPASTIRNHKCDPKKMVGAGRPHLLNSTQEKYLVELLKNLECKGVRLTKRLGLRLSSEYVQLVTGDAIKSFLSNLRINIVQF